MSETIARIGVIADTHGRLHPRITEVFDGVELVVHAGDVGAEKILFELQAIAPVVAVEGNMDAFFPAWPLAPTAWVNAGRYRVFLTHQLDPVASAIPEGANIVVAGHTHRPDVRWIGSTLFVNPGSASRNRTPEACSTVAIVSLDGDVPSARIVELD